jgi:hypothetical protein
MLTILRRRCDDSASTGQRSGQWETWEMREQREVSSYREARGSCHTSLTSGHEAWCSCCTLGIHDLSAGQHEEGLLEGQLHVKQGGFLTFKTTPHMHIEKIASLRKGGHWSQEQFHLKLDFLCTDTLCYHSRHPTTLFSTLYLFSQWQGYHAHTILTPSPQSRQVNRLRHGVRLGPIPLKQWSLMRS